MTAGEHGRSFLNGGLKMFGDEKRVLVICHKEFITIIAKSYARLVSRSEWVMEFSRC